MRVSCTKISKLKAWRGGAQILVIEDARLLDRCEARRKEWAKHWQCDEEVQNVEGKLWKNEELRSVDEALPRLKECHLEEVWRLYKSRKVPLDLIKETRGEFVELLEKVEQCGRVAATRCHE